MAQMTPAARLLALALVLLHAAGAAVATGQRQQALPPPPGDAPPRLLPSPPSTGEGEASDGRPPQPSEVACLALPGASGEELDCSSPLLARGAAAEGEVARQRRAEDHSAAARRARREAAERAEVALQRLQGLLERLGGEAADTAAGRAQAAAEGARHAYGGALVMARKAFGERLGSLSGAGADQPLQHLVESAIEAAHEVQRLENGRANEMRHLLNQMWREEQLQVRVAGKEAKEAAEEALQMLRHEASAQMLVGSDESAEQQAFEEKEPGAEGLRDKAVILRELAEEMVEDYYRQARRSVEGLADSIKASARQQVAAMVREVREASEMVLKRKAVAQAAKVAARSLQREAAVLEREAAVLGEEEAEVGAPEATPASPEGAARGQQSWVDWAPALASLGALATLLGLPLLLLFLSRRMRRAEAEEAEAEAEAAPGTLGQEVPAGPTLIEKRVRYTRQEVKVTVCPAQLLVPEACSAGTAAQPIAG